MNTGVLILSCLVAAVAVALAVLLLVQGDGGKAAGGTDSVAVDAERSVITVRRVGEVTSVSIRPPAVSDHWEGEEGITIPHLPVERTREDEPELYEEYLSPTVSATRKYEIIDDLYSRGYTLPYISGLYEQLREELRSARAARPRKAPVNLTPQQDPSSPDNL